MYILNKNVCHNGKWFKQGESCPEEIGKDLMRMGHADYVNDSVMKAEDVAPLEKELDSVEESEPVKEKFFKKKKGK